MKQQVTDITEALNGMASEMRSMRETIDAQRTEIHALNRNIESLNYDLRRERQKSKELEERLAKYEKPDRNSCFPQWGDPKWGLGLHPDGIQ